MKTKTEISQLPTILDVLEQISSDENASRIQDAIAPTFLDEGRYIAVSDKNNRSVVMLSPAGGFEHYYRGQNKFHDPCIPNIFREKDAEKIAINRIKAHEFMHLISTHPVIQEINSSICRIDGLAIAQHYELNTNILDITSNKWIAAFFACTQYVNGQYLPVDENFEDGYGVMYVSRPEYTHDIIERTRVIGYQYFPRPSKQAAYGYEMSDSDNFNDSPFFNKIEFRHNKSASEWVYAMSYNQKRFFPDDILAQKAIEIKESNYVTHEAVRMCWCDDYEGYKPTYLPDLCKKHGIDIGHEPQTIFSAEEIAHDLEYWNTEERTRLRNSIFSFPPVKPFDFENYTFITPE